MTETHAEKGPEREGSSTGKGIRRLSNAKLRSEALKAYKKNVASFGELYKKLSV